MALLPEPFSSVPFYRLRYTTASPIHEFGRSWTNTSSTSTDPGYRPVKVWMKREDQSSPLLCCGNKYRKLEYIIPDILNTPGVTTIVTEGGLQSNHAAQVSSVAAQLGLECELLLDENAGGLSTAPSADVFRASGNVQIDDLLGAHAQVHGGSVTKESVMNALVAKGKVPYWIPSGASSHPLGGLGFARCAFEIAAQEQEWGLGGSGRFDYIFVACGSGSTLAGLISGFKLLDKTAGRGGDDTPQRQLIGIMASPKSDCQEMVLSIAQTAGGLIGLDPQKDLSLDDVRVDDRFGGSGYGVLDAKLEEVLQTVARREGVLMDPVYSGKALEGMLHWLKKGELEQDVRAKRAGNDGPVNVLFIHTGGQAAFSAYAGLSR